MERPDARAPVRADGWQLGGRGALEGDAAADVSRRHGLRARRTLRSRLRVRRHEPYGQALERVSRTEGGREAAGDVPHADQGIRLVNGLIGHGALLISVAVIVLGIGAGVMAGRLRTQDWINAVFSAVYTNFLLVTI